MNVKLPNPLRSLRDFYRNFLLERKLRQNGLEDWFHAPDFDERRPLDDQPRKYSFRTLGIPERCETSVGHMFAHGTRPAPRLPEQDPKLLQWLAATYFDGSLSKLARAAETWDAEPWRDAEAEFHMSQTQGVGR